MKKIGFIDYFLNEWHADNYPAWIKRANDKLHLDMELAYAYGETEPNNLPSNADWCRKFGVTLCSSIKELCEKSDYIIVLAPSNPETHLRYAKEVLPYKKVTYIDKTFAPDAATAEKIYELSQLYGTPIFSTSALRFATELQEVKDVDSLFTMGGGSNLPEYVIHQIEMVVSTLKKDPISLFTEHSEGQYYIHVSFTGGAAATMIYANPLPFAVYLHNAKGEEKYIPIVSDFFAIMLEKIMTFFKTGVPPFAKEETINAMKIREAVILSLSHLGEIISL